MSIRHMSQQLVRQTKPGQYPQFHINANVSKERKFKAIDILNVTLSQIPIASLLLTLQQKSF